VRVAREQEAHLDAARVSTWRVHGHSVQIGEDFLEVLVQVPVQQRRHNVFTRMMMRDIFDGAVVFHRYGCYQHHQHRRRQRPHLSWFKFSILLGAMCSWKSGP